MAIKQLTVRGVDRPLERRLREEAMSADVSLNEAAMRLLRRGAGLEETRASARVGNPADHLIGTWSDADARVLAEAIAVFEQVDEDFWEWEFRWTKAMRV